MGKDALSLMQKGALVEKRERFRQLIIRKDQLIENITAGTFHFHPEDLASIKDEHVLEAARDLAKVLKEARRLQAELED